MDKLNLDLDDLEVESFSADSRKNKEGTVEGNSDTYNEDCFYNSDGATCNDVIYDTCGAC